MLSKPSAIKKIYKLKKRPKRKPLQILVSSLKQAKLLGNFDKKTAAFAMPRWPGPLTLIVHKTNLVPKLITGGTNKVGLRIPNHRTILNLIRKCGPVVATSANEAGESPALSAREVKERLPGLDYVLPGRVKIGRASKVIDTTNNFKLLRK